MQRRLRGRCYTCRIRIEFVGFARHERAQLEEPHPLRCCPGARRCIASAGRAFGPEDYDECILDAMKGVTSDLAAKAIILSCRERFPKTKRKTPSGLELDLVELAKLDGRAGLRYANKFGGTIYNGNPGLTIVELSITISTEIIGTPISRVYVVDVHIRPMSTGDFEFDILVVSDKDADYPWYISGAMGY